MPLKRLSPTAYRMQSLRARLRRQEGAALLEFAFSLGIFLAVTFGIMFVCLTLFTYEYVNFAAREAARWAAVRGADCYLSSQSMPGCGSAEGATATDIQSYVASLNYPLIDSSILSANSYSNIQVSWESVSMVTPSSGGSAYATWVSCTIPSTLPAQGNGCNNPGDAVQITVSYPIVYNIPFIGDFSPKVHSTAQMVISQ